MSLCASRLPPRRGGTVLRGSRNQNTAGLTHSDSWSRRVQRHDLTRPERRDETRRTRRVAPRPRTTAEQNRHALHREPSVH
eukprot:699360-Prymnesium_polylepis.1